ncbi:guanine deaminase [Condylostylus longicornis]|uniref:guanine deaminase n=1 Tax=Condylostylus longicornis TaxID=2530218 RepID=UPI00244E2EFC|nr:guanine deaminase [Condylostylus longicornis]
MSKVFIGQIFNPQSFDNFDEFIDGFIIVTDDGKIKAYGNDSKKWKENVDANEPVEIIKLSKTQFLMPGFVDCHIHGPQFPQIGLGLDLPLLGWLNKYTFPLESKYNDEVFAAKVYEKVVNTTIRNGTTFASYFGSNHTNGTIILAKEAVKQGQRALVGKVCSNQNCPAFYIENTDESISETEKFIKQITELKNELVKPIITPRFAVSCSMDLMKSLAEIAKSKNLHIQSHISENLDEIKFVKELFGEKTYSEVYDEAGLMTDKTIMAHAVHLEDSELNLFVKNKTSIAHCPSSNNNLGSGRCNVQRLLSKGIKVGLGTDVSGGNSPSILNEILRAMEVSHHIAFNDSKHKVINFKNAIYLATLAGAEALAMDNVTGNFKVGKDFDALLIDIDILPIVNIEIPREETPSPEANFIEMIQKFIYTGDDRNIIKVFVKGNNIKK